MFQASLSEVKVFKKIVEAIKDLVNEVNIETSPTGLSLQAMDSSHVALVSLELNGDGFEEFRSDRPMTLGINMGNLAKVMKLSSNDDSIVLKATENTDKLTVIFKNKSKWKRNKNRTREDH